MKTSNDKWQVNFFGDGEYWEREGLTRTEAEKAVNNCPSEFMASMEPMEA